MSNHLTPQLEQLRTFLLNTADTAIAAAVAARNDTEVARLLNLPLAPTFWAFRTSLSEEEAMFEASPDGTLFSFTALIARSVQEQFVWARMFSVGQGTINPSLSNVRAAFADIFSGSQSGAPAQRAHLLAVARRPVTVYESIYATGTGTTVSPGLTPVEGPVSLDQVGRALNG